MEMTDEEFIGYCDIHCGTPRALFSGAQINRLARLAMRLEPRHPENEWLAAHEDTVKPLVKLAREHLEAKRR
jgi:N-acetyl-anhydromuramyl-L-alanine amidase AmpD